MFDDIRPYRNEEVVPILKKLVNEKELQSIQLSALNDPIYAHHIWPIHVYHPYPCQNS